MVSVFGLELLVDSWAFVRFFVAGVSVKLGKGLLDPRCLVCQLRTCLAVCSLDLSLASWGESPSFPVLSGLSLFAALWSCWKLSFLWLLAFL